MMSETIKDSTKDSVIKKLDGFRSEIKYLMGKLDLFDEDIMVLRRTIINYYDINRQKYIFTSDEGAEHDVR